MNRLSCIHSGLWVNITEIRCRSLFVVKVRVRIVPNPFSPMRRPCPIFCEVDEVDRLAGARPCPQRPPCSFHPLGGGSDPPCWRLPFTSHSSVSVPPRSIRKRKGGRSGLCDHTTYRGRGTVTHQSE